MKAPFRLLAAGLGLAALVALAGCSPEAARVRGSSNPGADVGNRGAELQLHAGGSEAFFGTPNLNPRLAAKR